MRKALMDRMIEVRDTSMVPEAMFQPLAGDQPVSAYLAKRSKEDLHRLVNLAWTATCGEIAYLPVIHQQLHSEDPLARYWAAQGCLVLGKQAESAKDSLVKLTRDPFAEIRITAAEALHHMGVPSIGLLINELRGENHEEAKFRAVNALVELKATDQVPDDVIAELGKGKDPYLQRHFQNLKTESRRKAAPKDR